MYIFTLVTDVQKVVEKLRAEHGDFKLAMLYGAAPSGSTNWNLILSADWTDRLGVAEATNVVAQELHATLGLENRRAISRVTILKTRDRFVEDVTSFYPVRQPEPSVPLRQIMTREVADGSGFVFYSQPEIAA